MACSVLTHCVADVGGGSVPNGRRNSLARIPLRWMIRQCFKVETGIQFHRDSFEGVGLNPDTLYPFVRDRPQPLKPLPSTVSELRASAHKAEATEATLTDEADASLLAESTFQSEEAEDLADSISPIYDQLKLSPGWWILEFLPMRHHVQNREDMLRKPYWSYVFFSQGSFVFPLQVTYLGVVILRINRGLPRRVPAPAIEREGKICVHRSVKTRMEAEGLEGGRYRPRAQFEHLDFEWVD